MSSFTLGDTVEQIGGDIGGDTLGDTVEQISGDILGDTVEYIGGDILGDIVEQIGDDIITVHYLVASCFRTHIGFFFQSSSDE